MLTHRSLYLLMTLTSVMARPQTTPALTSSLVPSSHLLFFLSVEKELIPQTADLADRAYHILKEQCRSLEIKTSACVAEAEKLPTIAVLGALPSAKTLQKEKSKLFTKYLLREAYISVYKLQKLLEAENNGVQFLTDFTTQMDKTRQQLKSEVESLYGAEMPDRRYIGVEKSKKRYLRLSRVTSGNCRPQHDKSACRTEAEYRLRLLYSTYTRLLRVNHVLDYLVRLSWLSVENST